MRILQNWIDSYMEFTAGTESLEFFNKWVAVSTIASALQKKSWLELGRLKVFANMYIVLVANPGVARKTQSMSYATKIMRNVHGINIASDTTTVQGLIDFMEESITYDQLPDGKPLRHTSLSILAREFEAFFATGTSRMIAVLTSLYDCEFDPWEMRTKSYGTIVLPAVYLNMVAATTPRTLSECLSELAVGGGLTSRIIFLYADGKSKNVAFPEWSMDLQRLQQDLSHDLSDIRESSGPFVFSEDAKHYWENWYAENNCPQDRIEKSKQFDGWYSRRFLHILKVAMCLSAAQGDSQIISTSNLVTAIEWVEEVERTMGSIYLSRPENTISKCAQLLLKEITERTEVFEDYLRHLVWRVMRKDDFDIAIKELLAKKKCTFEVVDKKIKYKRG